MRVASRAIAIWAVLLGGSVGYLHLQSVRAADPQSAAPAPPAAPSDSSSSPPDVRAALDQYCVGCHNPRLTSGGIDLEQADLSGVPAHADLWERVIAKLRTREMPPAAVRRRPDPETYAHLTTWFESAIDRDAAAHPNPGRVGPAPPEPRRVSERDPRSARASTSTPRALLPADDADQHGFDNIADVLSISPALLERYIAGSEAASAASRSATSTPRPVVETYRRPETG